jgi:DNA replication and repair protein RecF
VPVTTFLPERLLVVRGAPARRRALLDRLVSRIEPGFSRSAASYVRAMTQRNALLRRHRGRGAVPEAELLPWDAQLVEHGAVIREARARVLASFDPRFAARFEELTGFTDGSLQVELRGADLAEALLEVRGLDARRATTGAGPHLDDIAFRHGDRDLRSRGSTGEQRATLLAFALAEADVVREVLGVAPVLLLDEPLAELDADRRERLLAAVSTFPQAVLTATDHDAAHTPALAAIARMLAVHSGELWPWTPNDREDPPPSAS